jgi:hypothetical protein
MRTALAAADRLPPHEWTEELRDAIEQAQALVERDATTGYEAERTKMLARFRKLRDEAGQSAESEQQLHTSLVSAEDELGKPLRRELAARWAGDAHAGALLAHLAQATSGPAPAKRWQEHARELVAATGDGEDLLRTVLTRALAAADGTRRVWAGVAHQWLADENAVLVRGAIWAAAEVGASWAPKLLAELAEHARRRSSRASSRAASRSPTLLSASSASSATTRPLPRSPD